MTHLQVEQPVDSRKPAAFGGADEPSPQILLFSTERSPSSPMDDLFRRAEHRIALEYDRWGTTAIDVRSALETARVLAGSARDDAETRLLCVSLGLFHSRRGAWSEARSALRGALATHPGPEDAAFCHWMIGRAALASAPPEEVIRRCAAALSRLRRAHAPDLAIRVRLLAAEAYLRAGDAARSRHALDRAMEAQELHPDPGLLLELHLCRADIHAEAGRWDAADLSCRSALALVSAAHGTSGIAAIERRRAAHALARGDVARARERLDASRSALGNEDELERGRILGLEARLCLEDGLEDSAWEAMRCAERSFRRVNAVLDLADLLVLRAEAVAMCSVDGALRRAAREGLFDARALYRSLGRARDVTTCELLIESLRSLRSEARTPPGGTDGSRARPPRVPRTRRLTQLGFLTTEPSILRAFEPLESLAKTTIPVLILGESGTGKEVLARALHRAAGGRGPFVAVNCGALPGELQESELFGHVRGAFTGAVADRIGLFEAADGGTLLLDEVGEMTPRAQVKLLRVLELGEVRRVGETKTRRIHVRVLAATNADLVANIRSGQFRRDLYYRLCGLKVELPPLRERLGDVPLLAAHFIRQFRKADAGAPPQLSSEALDVLLRHHWPGNVRELRFCVEKAHALTCALERDRIESDCIDIERVEIRARLDAEEADAAGGDALQPAEGLDRYLENLERRFILRALEEHRWNRTHAARALGGMSRTTLIGKMKRLGLFPERGLEEVEAAGEA